jgi:hypothetical protein
MKNREICSLAFTNVKNDIRTKKSSIFEKNVIAKLGATEV